MQYSRRNLAIVLGALAARGARGEDSSKRLASKAFPFHELPTKEGKTSKSHDVLKGETHTGYPVEVHVTELPAGESPHPPHQHLHEEMFLMQSGALDATVNGKTTRLTPGSVCYSTRTTCMACGIRGRTGRNISWSRWGRRRS